VRGLKERREPFRGKKIQFAEKTMDNRLPAGLRGRVILGKENNMTNEKAIMCLEDMKIKVPIPKAAKQARENNEALDVAIKALAESEHGTNLAEVGTDCISRQQAIEALAKFVPYAICDESTESYTNGLTDAYNLILQLPSAQPEIIRCKDCKHKHIENMVWTCPFGLPGGPDFYCGYGAERRPE
jgi:hypothetical protein